jgi:GT2 family glycosyltransferase
VTFLIPVLNGERTLSACLEAVLANLRGREAEIIVVDDGSTDGSCALLQRFEQEHRIRLLRGKGQGAACALNLGLAAASHEWLCQVDQDVVLEPSWLEHMLEVLTSDPRIAAVQGYYEARRSQPWLARLNGLDLEERYARIRDDVLDHVCTGNAAYRTHALRSLGGFDESLGYGYDNDLSYRLVAAGHSLRFCRKARSVHHWRSTLKGYLSQQYGVGYGRLDLVAKHPKRVTGDRVSSLRMMLHPPVTLAILGLAVVGAAFPASSAWALACALLTCVCAERAVAGVTAAIRSKDGVALLFPVVHLLRNLAWVTAVVRWMVRRGLGFKPKPEHSMFVSKRSLPP